jgi:DNA-binding response OmpR family regulator
MSRSILVVDDDEIVRETTHLILTQEGFAVTTASDGEAGLDVLTRARTHLLLLDIAMPGMGGLGVLRALKQLPEPRPAVMMMTARGDAETVRAAMGLGAHGYIVKPFTAKALVSRVRAVLSGPRAAAAARPALLVDDV